METMAVPVAHKEHRVEATCSKCGQPVDGGSRERPVAASTQLRRSLSQFEAIRLDRDRLYRVERYFVNFPNAITGAQVEIKKEGQRVKDALREALDRMCREL